MREKIKQGAAGEDPFIQRAEASAMPLLWVVVAVDGLLTAFTVFMVLRHFRIV